MTNPGSPHETPLPTDLFCAACDYDLRGLTPSGRCPECGQPIAVSLTDNAPPSWWSRRICAGLWLGLTAALINFASHTGLLLLWPNAWGLASECRAYWLFYFFGNLALQWLAIWIVTAPPPRGPARQPRLIWLTRAAPLILLAHHINWRCLDYVSESRLQWLFPWEALGAIAITASLGQWLIVVCRSHHWTRSSVLARVWQIALSLLIAADFGTFLYAKPIHHLLRIQIHGAISSGGGFSTSISTLGLMEHAVDILTFATLVATASRHLRQRPKALKP